MIVCAVLLCSFMVVFTTEYRFYDDDDLGLQCEYPWIDMYFYCLAEAERVN